MARLFSEAFRELGNPRVADARSNPQGGLGISLDPNTAREAATSDTSTAQVFHSFASLPSEEPQTSGSAVSHNGGPNVPPTLLNLRATHEDIQNPIATCLDAHVHRAIRWRERSGECQAHPMQLHTGPSRIRRDWHGYAK